MSQRGVVRKAAAMSRGQTMAEYALIIATIAVVATALIQSAGTILDTLVHRVVTLFG
jgi:Flp pilus assembly pilin Flp